MAKAEHWTPRRILAQAIWLGREHGLRVLWFRVLAECGYRRLLLLGRSVDEPIDDIEPGLSLEFSMLGPQQIGDYVHFRRGYLARSDVERRFDLGAGCYIARHEGRIVSATWVVREGSHWIGHVDYAFSIQHDEVYFYDSVTAQDLRGRNIAPALSVWVLRRLRAEGIRRTIVAVVPENRASLRAREKSGYRVCGMLRLVCIGRWKRLFHRTDLGRNPV